MVVRLDKYYISNRGVAGDVELAWQFIKSCGIDAYMACANPHSLVVASEDALFESALKKVDILLPDGTGVIIAAKISSCAGSFSAYAQ